MYKRKTYIINKEFQYGLIATFLIIVVCSLLLFSAGFVVFFTVTGMAGENAFDEFIEITRQVRIPKSSSPRNWPKKSRPPPTRSRSTSATT